MARREASCPLCGAKMQAVQLLDACEEIVDAGFGVLACHCPYCQGYLEIMPTSGKVHIGYLVGKDARRFDVVLSLPCEGLAVACTEAGSVLELKTAERVWVFRE